MASTLKFCNNCGKEKFVSKGTNYAKCCGGRVGLTTATPEQVAERAERMRRVSEIALRMMEEM